jgi:hypothetical protein
VLSLLHCVVRGRGQRCAGTVISHKNCGGRVQYVGDQQFYALSCAVTQRKRAEFEFRHKRRRGCGAAAGTQCAKCAGSHGVVVCV